MAAMSYGHIVVCGIAFPIDRLELNESLLILSGERGGRLRPSAGPVTIYGADGSEILACEAWLSWPKIGWRETFSWRLTIDLCGASRSMVPGNALESRDEVASVRQGTVKAISA